MTLLRIGSGLIVAKTVAIYTGPTGIAMLGQVQSFFVALNGITTAALGNGLVRYTAENHHFGFEACKVWWRAAIKWTLFFYLIVSITSFIFSSKMAYWVFGDSRYAWLITVSAILLPFSIANVLVTSVLNGQNNYRSLFYLGFLSLTTATIFMVFVISMGGIIKAMFAAAMFPVVCGLVLLVGVCKKPWFKISLWWGEVNIESMRLIGNYVLMALVSALAGSISILVVRKILIDQVGWETAGYWQAVWKISEVYLGVLTVALSTYFLPRLSLLSDEDEILKEVVDTVKIFMPIVLLLTFLVYQLRDIGISLIFTKDFGPARDLFFIQLVGDAVKILSWIYAYPMISRGAIKWYCFTEVGFSLLFIFASYFFIKTYGVQGANIAYLVNYLIYLLFVVSTFKQFIRSVSTK